MPKPLVAILSQNRTFTTEMSARLKDCFRIAAGASSDEVDELIGSSRPAGFITDFATTVNGGHAEDRLLEDLQQRFPKMAILMLTGADCPEPLGRRAACTDLIHLENTRNCETIEAVLKEQVPVDQGSSPSPSLGTSSPAENASGDDAQAEPPAEMVLSGISRKFETNTPRLQQMLRELEVAAKHDVTILLIGETGTGKTYLSKLIHEVSPRREEPFLTVACGALPAELIESELFGHVKGAFTSAHADKEGKFLAAGGGTVLLDEIDVLGPKQQVKLLRVIETGEFEPVGSNQTIKSQARLVVASNLDLQPLVEQGKFRPDLYYRLNMLKYELPPMRERKPDIATLTNKFVREQSDRHNIEIKQISPNLFEALYAYPWPGNVRELENVIQRAVIYSRDGILEARHLPPHILQGMAGPVNDPSVTLTPSFPNSSLGAREENSLGRQVALTERDIIEQTLFRNNFSRTNTAKDLGISRVTLYNKMKKHQMTKRVGARS